MRGLFSSRKFRQGTMATAITVVVVAIVVVINFVSTTLTDRFGLILDLTPTKLMSITDETKEYIADLPADVVIYVLSKEEDFTAMGDIYTQANEVLKRYDTESDQISLSYENIIADPTFTQRYPTLQLSATSILVTSGDRVRDITPYDLYETQMDQNTYQSYITASKAEQTLTSAILAVTSDATMNVAVITGHNEEDITPFRTLLQSNNYLVDQVSILTDDIDPIYDVAIIAGPTRDYEEEELQRLDRFIANGDAYDKTLFFLASSEQTALPNLDAFLADWGVIVEPGMVIETDPALHVPNAPYIALLEYADTAEQGYSDGVKESGLPAMAGYARPVRLAFEADSYITTSTLLQFSATAGVITEESGDAAVEPSGPIPYFVMGQHLSYDGTTPLTSQVLAAGSTALINEQFMGNASLANSEYLLTLLDTLTGKEDGVRIQSKPIGGETLNINAADAYVVGVIFTVVFPLAVLIFGITIWARRRHR